MIALRRIPLFVEREGAIPCSWGSATDTATLSDDMSDTGSGVGGEIRVRLSVAVPAVVLILTSAPLGLGLAAIGQASADRQRLESIPRTGMAILNAHACGEGETKQVLVLGVEDDFSPARSESGFIRPGRTHGAFLPRGGAGEYDQVNVDQGFADSFKVEGPVSGGVFVIRARSLNGSENDTLNFGALAREPNDVTGGWIGGDLLSALRTGETWGVDGNVLHANLEDMELRDLGEGRASAEGSDREVVQSLKDYLNAGGAGGWLDVFIQDDTAIDFMGLALCRPPAVRKGVTLMPVRSPGPEQHGLVHLACHAVRDPDRRCNPYVGDTVCAARLPVACIRPGDLPSPVQASGRIVTGHWSGGDIAVTEPVSGDQFRTVGEVEAFCARRFGPGWRIAALHDGGRNQSVSGRGDPATITDRVWVDIADQPHGTCWARQ